MDQLWESTTLQIRILPWANNVYKVNMRILYLTFSAADHSCIFSVVTTDFTESSMATFADVCLIAVTLNLIQKNITKRYITASRERSTIKCFSRGRGTQACGSMTVCVLHVPLVVADCSPGALVIELDSRPWLGLDEPTRRTGTVKESSNNSL